MRFWGMMLALVLALSSTHADAARRLGGGKSMGQQSGQVSQREAKPAPAQAGNANATPATAPSAAPPANRPWGAMLGGVAAGLGLAWLASALGVGEGLGQLLVLALGALVVFALLRMVLARRQPQAVSLPPYAFQGAANSPVATASHTYRPENVGNDASARPWERSSMAFEAPAPATTGSTIGSALQGTPSWGVPAGFDSEGFLQAAKTNFVTLQAAWDTSDIATLRSMMTDTMLGEIRAQLAEREAHGDQAAYQTEVLMLEARLLGIETQAQDYLASVEFSGLTREMPSAGPSPFREVWNMRKPREGSTGWLVAGVQALQ